MAKVTFVVFLLIFTSYVASQSFEEQCSTFLQNLPNEVRRVCTCTGISCVCSNGDDLDPQELSPCDAGFFMTDNVDSQTSNSVMRQVIADLDLTDFNPLLGVISGESEPVNHLQLMPLRPEVITTTFTVFDSINRDVGMLIDYQNLPSITTFSGQYEKIYFVAHDIRESATIADYVQMKNLLLDYNSLTEAVIMVDWSGGAGFRGASVGCCSSLIQLTRTVHNQQAVNTMVVGREVGLVCFLLVNNLKITAQNIHLIGFGLGSHAMHFAAVWYTNLAEQDQEQQQFNRKIGRVTGLDPTARDFQGYTVGAISPFLSNSDALFVDILHTSAVQNNGFGRDDLLRGRRGMSAASGHIDFYPNGGQKQPGCSRFQGLRGCYHRRALYYFIASLINLQAVRDNLEAYFATGWREFYDQQFEIGGRQRLESINLQDINIAATPGHVNVMGIQATNPNIVHEGLGLGKNTFFLFFQLDDSRFFVETDTTRLPGSSTVLNVVEESRLTAFNVTGDAQFDFTRFPSHDLSKINERPLNNLDLPACGQFNVVPNGRISMGLNTYDGQFPWTVAIHSAPNQKQPADGGLRIVISCSGSLLTSNLVLTAAHCFNTFTDGNNRIVSTNLAHVLTFGNNGRQPIAWRRVFLRNGVNFFIHPLYTKLGRSGHDVAIIRLFEPLRGMPEDGVYAGTADQPFNTLCWRSANSFTYENQLCEQLYIAGFGLFSLTPRILNGFLHWTVYNIQKIPLALQGFDVFTSPSMVAMINSETARLRNVCPGDSGAPVMLYTRIPGAENLPARVSPFRANLVATVKGGVASCDKATDPNEPDNAVRSGYRDVYNFIRDIVDGDVVVAEEPASPINVDIPFPPSQF